MRSIIRDLKLHLKEDFNIWTYSWTALFLIITISINYTVDFETKILNKYYKSEISLVFYTLFYLVGYFAVSIPQHIILKQTDRLKTKEFWLRSLFFIFLLGFSAYFYFHRNFQIEDFSPRENYFLRKIFSQIKPFLTIVFPLFIFWLIFDKKYKEHFYGLNLRGANLKPYAVMLAIMAPLIIGASFQSDFLSTYPILKPWLLNKPFGLTEWQTSALFEPFYGVSFFSVELIFRGAMVLGLARILGKDAILPMVSMYAFLHFGKPLGETIGSIFGGYILGVIALRSKHIFGGCMIHIGVAYLMELTALWQHYNK